MAPSVRRRTVCSGNCCMQSARSLPAGANGRPAGPTGETCVNQPRAKLQRLPSPTRRTARCFLDLAASRWMIGESMGRVRQLDQREQRGAHGRTCSAVRATRCTPVVRRAAAFFLLCRCGCNRIGIGSYPSTPAIATVDEGVPGRRRASFSLQVQGSGIQDRRCHGLLGPSGDPVLSAHGSKPATQVTAVCFFHTFQR
jgi:hypothetical protein